MMTYKEKFKEAFGYFPKSCTNDDAICDFVNCELTPCVSCKYLREDGTQVKWGDEIHANPRLQYFEIPVLKKDEKCIDCEYFSDKEYYADNSIFVSAVAFGSCTKCQRNITLTSPNTEAPSWCPIKKGDKDEL